MDMYQNAMSPYDTGRPILLAICCGLLALLFEAVTGGLVEGAVAPCPSPIPEPTLQAGDTWNWQDEKGANWTRRFIRRTEDGLFVMDSRPDRPQFLYDNTHTLRKVNRNGVWVTEEALDFPLIGKPVLVFPLQAGKSWSWQTFARQATGGETRNYIHTFTVLGCEQVTIPAGTFSAVVIEEEERLLGGDWGVRTWWYAPEVKYFIRMTLGRASHPGWWSAFRDWALTSYRVAGGPVAEPRPAPAIPPAPHMQQPAPPIPSRVMAPVWERGYEWKYRWSSPRGTGTFVWSVLGEELLGGAAYYVVRTGTRDIYYTKEELAWRMDRVEGEIEEQAIPAKRWFKWPLEVGKEWGENYHWENPGERRTAEEYRRFKVEAIETVAVPQGSFQAYRITEKDRSDRLRAERWYVPEVKWIVKDEIYFSYGVQTRELLEHRLKPSIGPQPAQGSGR